MPFLFINTLLQSENEGTKEKELTPHFSEVAGEGGQSGTVSTVYLAGSKTVETV